MGNVVCCDGTSYDNGGFKKNKASIKRDPKVNIRGSSFESVILARPLMSEEMTGAVTVRKS